VVTITPLRRKLAYGPADVMMLSPETAIFSGTGFRPGYVIDHPDVVPVAVNTKFVEVVSPLVGTECMSHFPATSARLMGAGAGGVVASVVEVVVDDAIALVLSTAASFFFAHPASATTMQQLAMRVVRCSLGMGPPVQVTDGFARRLPSETNVKREVAGGKFAAVTCFGRPSGRHAARL
jgi:hypothetical protein